jgi:phospholipase/lecithinase/hemolysin
MSGTTSTSPFSTIYAFGDSLSDAGNVSILTALTGEEPVSPPYYHTNYGVEQGTVFSNGPVWVQDLSEDLGLGQLAPSLAGGTDFAYGGAETGSTPQNSGNSETALLSLPNQLSQFKTEVGRASSSALFTLSIGGNDIIDILAGAGNTAQQQSIDVTDSVNNEISAINQMASDGMKNLLVMDVPNMGLVPDVTTGYYNGGNTPSAGIDSLATLLSQEYNTQLEAGLATAAANDGFSYHVVDVYSLITTAVSDPSAFGFTNVTSPTWTGNFTSDTSGGLTSTNLATQNEDLFWDHIHPTASAHAIIGNIADSEVDPSVVYQEDLNTTVTSIQQASPYYGLDTNLQSEFTPISTDNLALFAGAPDMFLETASGNNIIVAKSGTNVMSSGIGSSFLISGSGTDSIYVDGSQGVDTWNEVLNFHSGDALSVLGYTPNVSNVVWTDGVNNDGATLNIDLKGNGSVWASDTFLGVPVATAEKYAVSITADGSSSLYTVTA